MNKTEKKQIKEKVNLILKYCSKFLIFVWKGYKFICDIINKYVPKEHVLMAFYIATTLSWIGLNFLSEKIYLISWFVTTAIITTMISRKFNLYIQKEKIKDKQTKLKDKKC